jgi:threonine/homoserine/homoserine lactone efflux protein
MTFILPFLFGFIASIIGISIPGLINMTAAKVSLKDGRDRALLFVFGALIVIFFQTYIAILFARYIDSRPDVMVLFREIGFGIFAALTIYFFFFAKKSNPKDKPVKIKSKTSRFFLGMLLSALNFFPIPYYVFITITLSSFGYFNFRTFEVFLFLLGVLMGSFSVFYYYIRFFNKLGLKTDFFNKNMNIIIGSITGAVALITLVNIIKYYY